MLKLLEAQCAYKRESVVILIEPTLVLFPPLNCTHILEHSEINSTCRKYSRKYGTADTIETTLVEYMDDKGLSIS